MTMALLALASVLTAFVPLTAGWYCPGDWVGFSDDDPHMVINFTNIDLPICYDLPGNPDESYKLVSLENEFLFVGHLIPAPKFHDGKPWTYFDYFTFTTPKADIVITIDHEFVNLTKNGETISAPWPHKGKYKKHIYPGALSSPADAIEDLYITHMMKNYLHVTYEGTSVHIDRHNRKTCHGKGKGRVCPRTKFLGVYVHPEKDATYGGLLGEHIGEPAVLITKDDSPFNRLRAFAGVNLAAQTNHILLHNGRALKVIDHEVIDRMKNEHLKCYKILDNEKFMHKPLVYYEV